MPYDLVSVFHKSFFPRRVLVTEIYFNSKLLFQSLVMNEEKVIVKRHSTKLGESLFDSFNCILYTFD